jgi:2-hydroxy-6-oxonona-2,4-dienedioate hydrolase
LAALIPQGEFLLVEGASHWPQWEGAEVFNAAAITFLDKQYHQS